MPVGAELHHHILLLSVLASFISGTGLTRVLIYIAQRMPPLPKDAGFWAQFAYNILHGASGLDPNATFIPAGAVSKIMGVPADPAKGTS